MARRPATCYRSRMSDLYPRSHAQREATWNRESVFLDWNVFGAELRGISAALPELSAYPGTLTESPERLLDWLEFSGALTDRLGRIMTYVTMATSVDSADNEAKARAGQARAVLTEAAGAMAFAEPELSSALGQHPDLISKWIQALPALEPYRNYLQALLRKARYMLSAEVEGAIGRMGSALAATTNALGELAASDMNFADITDSHGATHSVSQGNFMAHYTAEDRARRKAAFESFSDSYRGLINTYAAGYIGVIEQNLFDVRMRGYESILHARLEPTGLPVSVFHNLIDTFVENLTVWHRYWEAKRRILGLPDMRPWDRWAPLGSGRGPEVSYAKAIEWTSAALEPMGTEYVAALRKGALEDRWVDWAPNAGKRQGAFSVPAYPGTFPFIMQTYQDSVFSMSTLAHELGHSMHHYLIARHQKPVYNGLAAVWRSSSVAETASNFHQAMLRTWLRAEYGGDDALMLAVVDEAMMNYHRYCFLMPTLARFELEVCRRAEAGEPLNAPILGQIMAGYFAEGFGETLTDDSQRSAVTWAQFQHLYRPFYTFQYAVGISAASIAADRIHASEPDSVERYLEMLRTGYSLPAIEVFGVAGIDMTTTAPMASMFARLNGLVSMLEERAG